MLIQKIVQFDIKHGEEAVVHDNGWILFRNGAMRSANPKCESDFREPPDDEGERAALNRVFSMTYSYIHNTRDKQEIRHHLESIHGQGFPIYEPKRELRGQLAATGWYVCPTGCRYHLVANMAPQVQEHIGDIEARFRGIIEHHEHKLNNLRERAKEVKQLALNTMKPQYIEELEGLQEQVLNTSRTLEWAKEQLEEIRPTQQSNTQEVQQQTLATTNYIKSIKV